MFPSLYSRLHHGPSAAGTLPVQPCAPLHQSYVRTLPETCLFALSLQTSRCGGPGGIFHIFSFIQEYFTFFPPPAKRTHHFSPLLPTSLYQKFPEREKGKLHEFF